MKTRGAIRIDPGSLEPRGEEAVLQLVVVHSEQALTAAVLRRAAELVPGLNARVVLAAVHAVPFPASFASAAASHARLVSVLADLAEGSALPVTPHVVMARDREEGIRSVLQEESIVLVGTRRCLWATHEEKLASLLAKDGHQVVLLHVEPRS